MPRRPCAVEDFEAYMQACKSTESATLDRAIQGDFLEALGIPGFILDPAGSILTSNHRWREHFGDSSEHPSLIPLLAESDRDRVARMLRFAVEEWRPVRFSFEAESTVGSSVSFECVCGPHRDTEGGEYVLVCTCWDVTDQRRNEDRLAFMAGHDPLTGLPNRRSFEEALARTVSRRARGSRAALMIIDMDYLKQLNDSRGHGEGDQALVNLAMLIRRQVRAEDLPARIGGDEFAVLLEDASTDEAFDIAERIREAASDDLFVDLVETGSLGVSVGIADMSAGIDGRAALERADAALYAAKEAGRNRVTLWADTMSMQDRSLMSNSVAWAFESEGFSLVYQPVVRLADGSVSYFESLVRMRDESGAIHTPAEFLTVVNRLGLMSELTKRVVHAALEGLRTVESCCVSVNLSGSDLADTDLLDEVVSSLTSAPHGRDRLFFEIPESELLTDLGAGRRWMQRLSEFGCRFVLDDFGSGIGMFLLLRESCVHQVKLSRTVMHAAVAEKANHQFVRALRELIETQGKTAVAGYLESEALIADAVEAGFTWGQGFYIQKPDADLPQLARRMGCL